MNKNNIRVAMLIQNFHPTIGGAEKQALELARGLNLEGCEVHVLTRSIPACPARERLDGVVIHRLPAWGTGFFNSLTFLLSSFGYLLIKLSYIDVLHVHLISSHALAATLLGKMFRKKVIIKIGGGKTIGELALSRSSWLGRIKLFLIRRADPHLVIVNHDQNEELEASGLSGLNVTMIPNGVDLKRFHPLEPDQRAALRKTFGWKGSVFLFVGRFNPDKLRLDIFENWLEGWQKALRSAKQPLLFDMIGEGPLEPAYRSLIEKFGLGDSVRIVGPKNDVARYYQAADFFVLPSITEGLSNALLESMACGLPVLGSRVPGIDNIVQDGAHGYLFDPLNPDDIWKTIETALHQQDRMGSLREACLENAGHYSIKNTIARYLDLYREAA